MNQATPELTVASLFVLLDAYMGFVVHQTHVIALRDGWGRAVNMQSVFMIAVAVGIASVQVFAFATLNR